MKSLLFGILLFSGVAFGQAAVERNYFYFTPCQQWQQSQFGYTCGWLGMQTQMYDKYEIDRLVNNLQQIVNQQQQTIYSMEQRIQALENAPH